VSPPDYLVRQKDLPDRTRAVQVFGDLASGAWVGAYLDAITSASSYDVPTGVRVRCPKLSVLRGYVPY
jgi:hypothetical protein